MNEDVVVIGGSAISIVSSLIGSGRISIGSRISAGGLIFYSQS